jgi:hypothetical protein
VIGEDSCRKCRSADPSKPGPTLVVRWRVAWGATSWSATRAFRCSQRQIGDGMARIEAGRRHRLPFFAAGVRPVGISGTRPGGWRPERQGASGANVGRDAPPAAARAALPAHQKPAEQQVVGPALARAVQASPRAYIRARPRLAGLGRSVLPERAVIACQAAIDNHECCDAVSGTTSGRRRGCDSGQGGQMVDHGGRRICPRLADPSPHRDEAVLMGTVVSHREVPPGAPVGRRAWSDRWVCRIARELRWGLRRPRG